jgi:hypothetical protein
MKQPARISQLFLAAAIWILCGAIGALLFSFVGAGYGLLVGIPVALLSIFMTNKPSQYEPGNPELRKRYLRKQAEKERQA